MPFIEFTGHARLDKRTKRLTRRLTPDDVAIIDHTDLDRVSAEELVDSGVRVVVNVAPSQSGRFPNPGPLLLVRGGVRLIDVPGAPLFDELSDGDPLTVRGASLFRNGTCVARGRALEPEELADALADQRGRVTEALEIFAENTLQYLREEGRLLAEGIDFPALRTRFRERHALVVHAYADGAAPGAERLERLGLPYADVAAPGISEAVARLLAFEKGAELIVAVGTHFNLIEFLERDRAGMSSTFVTRLKVGEILIDAKGVSRLVSRQVGLWPLVAFAAAGLGAVVVAIVASPGLRHFIGLLTQRIEDLLGIG